MGKILFALSFVLAAAGLVHAAAEDRFGNQRNEVPRSSYTESADNNVMIASAPTMAQVFVASAPTSGALYLRRAIFSGVNATTVTFYDTQNFTVNTTTRTKLVYVPTNSAGGVTGITSIDMDMYFSSGIVYNKEQGGIAPFTMLFDFTTTPRYRINQY